MDALADVAKLEEFFPLDASQRARAEGLLSKASVIIYGECEAAGVMLPTDSADDELRRELFAITCCDMVQRALVVLPEQMGVRSTQMTAGQYSQTISYINPAGDVYLTDREREHLGIICGQQIFSVAPRIGEDDGR